MIINILNKISFIVFCIGVCLADSENLLIPIVITITSIILFKITCDKIQWNWIFFIYFLLIIYYNIYVIDRRCRYVLCVWF